MQKAKTLDPLRGLKTWKKPEIEWKNFAASDFAVLLPEKLMSTTVGYTYSLTGTVCHTLTKPVTCTAKPVFKIHSFFCWKQAVKDRLGWSKWKQHVCNIYSWKLAVWGLFSTFCTSFIKESRAVGKFQKSQNNTFTCSVQVYQKGWRKIRRCLITDTTHRTWLMLRRFWSTGYSPCFTAVPSWSAASHRREPWPVSGLSVTNTLM